MAVQAMLYSTLHLAGFDISLDDLKEFRQLGSKTPGHPEAFHTPGVEAKRLLEESREKVAKYINADSNEIIFCSSGSEANNLAIKGFLAANKMYECIITTQVEHPSVYNTCLYMFESEFYKTTTISLLRVENERRAREKEAEAKENVV